MDEANTGARRKQVATGYVIILFLLPMFYWVNLALPWSTKLFTEGGHWIPWAASIEVLHWSSVVYVLYILRKSHLRLADIGYKLNRVQTLFFVGGYFIIGFAAYFYVAWKLDHVPGTEFPRFYSVEFITSVDRLIWVWVSFSAGFCEELIYRGCFISVMDIKRVNKWIALPISAFFFTIMHSPRTLVEPVMGLFLFIFGLLMGLLFILTRRLWVSMSVHMLYDLLILFH